MQRKTQQHEKIIAEEDASWVSDSSSESDSDDQSNYSNKESLKDTVTDKKFLAGAGTGFVAGAKEQ